MRDVPQIGEWIPSAVNNLITYYAWAVLVCLAVPLFWLELHVVVRRIAGLASSRRHLGVTVGITLAAVAVALLLTLYFAWEALVEFAPDAYFEISGLLPYPSETYQWAGWGALALGMMLSWCLVLTGIYWATIGISGKSAEEWVFKGRFGQVLGVITPVLDVISFVLTVVATAARTRPTVGTA